MTALNGELFGPDACFDLEDRSTSLHNSDLLDAIRQLSTFEERTGRRKTGVQRRVHYAGLDVEELGSIYESLLDYHPQVLREPGRFALIAGSQRKETGSYYTPPELVRELIESALVPVMEARRDAAKTKEEKQRALLSLTICDPAAGSGHFLLAAARHVGRELAIIRSGEAEPAPETYRAALRDVIRHCLYAVDKNPLAVDLCKVALWIEGHAPGLPLSFLDHRIRCGDGLIGVFQLDVLKAGVPDAAFKRLSGDDQAVCAELRRINRRDRGGELAKFSAEATLAELAGEFSALADMPDETPSDVRSKEELYRQLKESERVARLRNACDAWIGAFFAPRGLAQQRTAPTTADVWKALSGLPNHQRAALIDELSDRFHFFHWHLEFPEVFQRGGFDVVLGNPPWGVSQFVDDDFFPSVIADFNDLTAKRKKAAIREILTADAVLGSRFYTERRIIQSYNLFYRNSGNFTKSAYGKLNLYALFAERGYAVLNSRARAGLIVPTGLVTDEATSPLFQHFMVNGHLVSFIGFENEEFIFPGIANVNRFALATLCSASETQTLPTFCFYLRKVADISDAERRFQLSESDIHALNPTLFTCPVFRTQSDARLTMRKYQSFGILTGGERAANNRWKISYRQGLFNMATDSDEFIENDDPLRRLLPLYEAKYIWHYDHRFGSYHRVGRSKGRGGRGLPPTELSEYQDPAFSIRPRYFLKPELVERKLVDIEWGRNWLPVWRDIANAKVERTSIFSIIPRAGVGDNLSVLFPECENRQIPALIAMLNSITFEYLVRQKLGGTHLTFGILRQTPAMGPNEFSDVDERFFYRRVLELVYTAHDVHSFAQDLGYDGPPFPWDPDRRALLKAELDAYFAYLYGLSRDELRYILDPKEVMGANYPSETFRVLKENEIRAYGEYRTRRLVLEGWDRFAEDGTFDPARLRDPSHFDAVQRALVETRGRVESLERELQELLARSDAAPLPTLFVEGESDVVILTAAWQAFHPTDPLPVTVLAAGGTRQMESLAGRGGALRQLLGERLVFALADNDREGRALIEDGRTRRGGVWRQQSNGIHWCLLAPTAEFEQAMRRFRIDAAYWPSTIENAFPAALRRQAVAEAAYSVEEGRVQAAFLEEPSTAVKALDAVRDLDRTNDDAALYFRPPDPETKLTFAAWIAAPERRDRATFAAFGPILEGLRAVV